MIRLLLFVAFGASLAGCSTCVGEVLSFSNDGTYRWPPGGNGGYLFVGHAFDPTRIAADQSSVTTMPSMLTFAPYMAGGSYSVIFGNFTPRNGLAIAREPVNRLVNTRGGEFPQFTELPVARAYSLGQQVGAGSTFESTGNVYHSWTAFVNTIQGPGGTHSLIGDDVYVGFRVPGPDGVHYGYVRFVYEQVQLPPGTYPDLEPFGVPMNPLTFVPRGWAFETLPNTPISVVPGVGPAAVLGAGMLFAALRRRRCSSRAARPDCEVLATPPRGVGL